MEKSEIKAIFRHIENNKHRMSPYQADFIKGLKKYYSRNNKLSFRQEDALKNIVTSLETRQEEEIQHPGQGLSIKNHL